MRGWIEISEDTWDRMANRAGVRMPKRQGRRDGWVEVPMSESTIRRLNVTIREEGHETIDAYFNARMDESLDNFLRSL